MAPQPTADSGWPLVKTSASGPMPTSRYWHQRPSACSAALAEAAASLPGSMSRSDGADQAGDAGADRLGAGRVAGGALLDDALDHRAGEGDAAGLERLQVAGGEQRRPLPQRGRDASSGPRSRPALAAT